MEFKLLHTDPASKARAGWKLRLHTGLLKPQFLCQLELLATVKGVHQRELKNEINPDIILGNTYHLYLVHKQKF